MKQIKVSEVSINEASEVPHTPHNKGQHATVLILAWITGACGLTYEYTFSKLAADLLGNTVEQWALTIAVMLFAMGLGAELQRRIINKQLLSAFILIEIILSIAGGWGSLLLLKIFTQYRDYFSVIQMALHFLIGAIIGMEIPLLTRLNASFQKPLKNNLAQILKLDYWGAFIGALVWIYVLIRFLETTLEVAFVIAIFNLLAPMLALLLYRKAIPSRKQRLTLWTMTCLVFLSCSYGWAYLDVWIPALEQHLFRNRIIVSATTPYQKITVTESNLGELRLYLNGQLQFSSLDEHIYHEMMVHPAAFLHMLRTNSPTIAPHTPRRALVLGGGDGLVVRELRKYPSLHEIVLVDIDAALIELARTHPQLSALNQNSLRQAELTVFHPPQLASPVQTITIPIIARAQPPHQIIGEESIRIYTEDAYTFLYDLTTKKKVFPQTYDLIIADFPDPSRIDLSKLYSRSFYASIHTLLAENGVFIQQASSPYYAHQTFALIGETLKQSGFSHIPMQTWIPSFGLWGWFIAQKKSYRSPREIYDALSTQFTLTVPTQFLSPTTLKRALLVTSYELTRAPTTTNIAPEKLSSQPQPSATLPPVNTLLNHLAYKTYLKELRRFD